MSKFSATVDGITVSAETAEGLQSAVSAIRGLGPTPAPTPTKKPKPVPKNATPPPPPKPKSKPKAWTAEEFVKKLAEMGPQEAILSVLSQAGVDPNEISAQINQISTQIQAVQHIAVRSSAIQALKAHGVKPTQENITELGNLLAAQEDPNARIPTYDNLDNLVNEAVKEEWLKPETPAAPKPENKGSKPREGNVLEFSPDNGLNEEVPGGGRKALNPFTDAPENLDDDGREVVEWAETAPLDELRTAIMNVSGH